MTTIAYSKGMLASESRATKKAVIDDDRCKKVWRLSDGSLFAGAGDYVGVLKLLLMLRASVKRAQKKGWKGPAILPTTTDKCTALLVTTEGTWSYEGGFWEKLKVPFYAIGSGAPYAMVAMECGKTAKEAITYAKGKDIYSGGKVQCLKL